jgi:GntR family transcriptional regulator, rspAB operon transcriptional repressor
MPTTDVKILRESDRIESELRRLILMLELEPGLAVSEAALMKQYGWGRTPLREAFQRLAEQSLLKIVPHQGAVVTPLSVFDFIEVMDAMSMVIGAATELACSRLSNSQLDRLEDLVRLEDAAAGKTDFNLVAETDYEFHYILAEASGNHYLRDYLVHLHRVATRFNFAAWKRDRNVAPSLAEHKELSGLLHQRDAKGAGAAMLDHIQKSRQRLMGSLR